VGAWSFTAERHALCVEALALLGDSDPERTERVEAQLVVTRCAWVSEPAASRSPMSAAEAEQRSTELHARHAAATGAARVGERVGCAEELGTLAAACNRDEDRAWAALWRLDAFCQLGRRVELNAEMMNLVAVARRLRSPAWDWRVAAARASVAFLDGHIADVPRRAAEALLLGAQSEIEDAPFVDLVLRSSLAVRTGHGLAEVEDAIRRIIVEAPFYAHGWHARVLLAMGRIEEACETWRALAPRLDDLPPDSPEWLVATAGHAELCAAARDRTSAGRLIESLAPFAELHVSAGIRTPYEGPVSLYLATLAAVTGDLTAARAHLSDSVQRSEQMRAPLFSAAARDALASIQRSTGPLTPREFEIAELVGDGYSNREIATRLVLSERTVENHISHILRKLEVRSRAGVASWISHASLGRGSE
jgi:DNA-binding CsgD family transcriptional regulator